MECLRSLFLQALRFVYEELPIYACPLFRCVCVCVYLGVCTFAAVVLPDSRGGVQENLVPDARSQLANTTRLCS